MRKPLILLLVLTLLGALAQDGEGGRRIIRIETQDGTVSGNIRFGPIRYQHPDPEGVLATVSNLTIFSQNAVLLVPEALGKLLLSEAQGQREASFEGGVRVARGRLGATGPALTYSEATGLGVLSGGADIRVEASEEGEDPTLITAAEVEFDVDTDRSVNRGDVELQSGNQTALADELTFAEEQDLGQLLNAEGGGQPSITRVDADGEELLISADEIRVLTEQKRLYAVGNVTVVDGSITSFGEVVFFDDALDIAEVIGNPARSLDEENGVELEAARIRQDIEFDFVEAIDASEPSDFSADDFQFAVDEEPAGDTPPAEDTP